MNLIQQVPSKMAAAEELYMRAADLLVALSRHGQQDLPAHVIQHLAEAAEAYQGAK